MWCISELNSRLNEKSNWLDGEKWTLDKRTEEGAENEGLVTSIKKEDALETKEVHFYKRL